MSRIVVVGSGAVTPVGWGMAPMMEAIDKGLPPEVYPLERSTDQGETITTSVMKVPRLTDRSLLPKSPRLRRASALGKYAAAAMFEALGSERFEAAKAGEVRVAVICTLMNGCVNYSNRFFGEVLTDPSVASPILFPETVYNAPSSHLSAVMNSSAPNDTLVGDGAEWFTGLELATEWLDRGDCDLCVVVATEEMDWLSAEAMGYYDSSMIPSEGSAAVVLGVEGEGPCLNLIPDPVSYAEVADPAAAMAELWQELNVDDDLRTIWSDGRNGGCHSEAVEDLPWNGPRLSVRKVLGEAMGASAALQTVAALEWLRSGRADRAVVTAVGGNEAAGGVVFSAS